MTETAKDTVVVRKNEIRLVRRPDSDKWQAHYKVKAIGKWIRKATNESDLDKAREKAEDMWMTARVLSQQGHPVVSKKFRSVAELVLVELERKIRLDATKRGSNNDYVGVIKKYLIPFFGKKNVDRIDQNVFMEFCEWRRETVGRELSHSTQLNHNAALNLIFDTAVQKGYMTNLQRPTLINKGEISGRRPSFSAAELEQLLAYLPTWIDGARDSRSRMYRELLAIYIPFVAATGLRPGTEMEYLEWRHIEVITDLSKSPEPFLQAHIRKGKTVRKNNYFTCILERSCWLYLEALRKLEPAFKDKTIEQVLEEKHPIRLFRLRNGEQPSHPSPLFKQLLEESGLLKCPITGDDRTLYSLRHYAITELIASGYTSEQIQSQVRTSAPMLSKHYNHLKPLMNAAGFSGVGRAVAGDAVSQLFARPAPNNNMMYFAELSTGLTMTLVLQNKPAVDELRAELSVGSQAQQTS